MIKLTSSKISSFSSSCLSSCLDLLCLVTGVGLWGPAEFCPSVEPVRNVGWPSMVLIIGFKRPPLSNSWAEILRTGVVAPEPPLDWLCVGDESSTLDEAGVACDTSQESTIWRVAFLE